MSTLREFHELEKHLKAQFERLAAIRNSEQFSKEVEFEKKLHQLMNRYSMNKSDVDSLLKSSVEASGISVHEQSNAYAANVKKSEVTRRRKHQEPGPLDC